LKKLRKINMEVNRSMNNLITTSCTVLLENLNETAAIARARYTTNTTASFLK
jgi:hypothetical protein